MAFATLLGTSGLEACGKGEPKADKAEKEEASEGGHEGEEGGEGHGHGGEEAKEGEAKSVPENVPVEELSKKQCEHKIPQIECDECRYELGIVKVPKAQQEALLVLEEVKSGAASKATMNLKCEAARNATLQFQHHGHCLGSGPGGPCDGWASR